MPSSDRARLAHKTHVCKSPRVQMFTQKFTCSNLRGSYFRVLVVGRENRKNLDLAKFSRYTVHVLNCSVPAAAKKMEILSLLPMDLPLNDCRDKGYQNDQSKP